MATRKPTDIVQLKLRLPEWLRRDIERHARKSGRSLNSEMVHALQRAYEQTKTESQIAEAARVAALATIEKWIAGGGKGAKDFVLRLSTGSANRQPKPGEDSE
jgi:hypothetical protein